MREVIVIAGVICFIAAMCMVLEWLYEGEKIVKNILSLTLVFLFGYALCIDKVFAGVASLITLILLRSLS